MTITQRVAGAAMLDRRVYEEVEADRLATGQAVAVVLVSSIAGGIGLPGIGVRDVQGMLGAVAGALVGWMAWAALTYLIGTRFLPERQTRADVGELLRTTAFASVPGVFRVLGVLPVAGPLLYLAASIWMLLAMIVAVRQALDYKTTGRAVGVCVAGWALSLVVAVVIGLIFAPTVT